MKTKRLSGHALISEGMAHDDAGRAIWRGGSHGGKCSCGALSEWLPSGSQRRAWHKAHKAEVLAAGGA